MSNPPIPKVKPAAESLRPAPLLVGAVSDNDSATLAISSARAANAFKTALRRNDILADGS
eukprot:CAMPEP_0197357702 /NCGR_PEP_ID=MMETSP0893-20130614/52908_1 /TAXON_ID=44058 ORGANISM="Aureoumbra lagunensis, Strain CCMP1510" /NCGR_SAMPLE_ID=MMETSP0893 /ASSEMBLY_ACC=CAM_ASM_000539 /LENGTH=59 /DNA_ID=CAMNT_0042876449 /DNA_START=794 /DNA_END=976 /DNA_ORIENTATION=+